MKVVAKVFRISMDKELYDWLEAQIEKRVFYNRRHGIEFALKRLKSEWEKHEAP